MASASLRKSTHLKDVVPRWIIVCVCVPVCLCVCIVADALMTVESLPLRNKSGLLNFYIT